MKYPTALAPTILSGVVYGPSIRCESVDGREMFLDAPNGKTIFHNFQPFKLNSSLWFVTHLQFTSSRGWIKTDPDCFHSWWMPRQKKKDANGDWIPGSELGLYFRKPFSWRFDVPGTMLDGELRHWIPTKGYLGGHFD